MRSTATPGERVTAAGAFRAPVVQGGSVNPKPVPYSATTDPCLAGFSELLIVPSWLIAAACADMPGCRRKNAGLANVTGTSKGPNVATLVCQPDGSRLAAAKFERRYHIDLPGLRIQQRGCLIVKKYLDAAKTKWDFSL